MRNTLQRIRKNKNNESRTNSYLWCTYVSSTKVYTKLSVEDSVKPTEKNVDDSLDIVHLLCWTEAQSQHHSEEVVDRNRDAMWVRKFASKTKRDCTFLV